MATHYEVIIYEEMLSLQVDKTPDKLTNELSKAGAMIWEDFRVVSDTIMVGELRRTHPRNFYDIFSKFDKVFFVDDSSSGIEELKRGV